MKIYGIRKYIIYLIGIVVMIAVAVAAASSGMKDGEIIYSRAPDNEEIINERIISGEDGVDIILEGEEQIKYEEKAEFRVNINIASEEDMIKLLPGIGAKRAAAIVEYRELAGGFNSVEELCEVNGIGEKIMGNLRPYCTIEGPSVQYAGEQENESDK